MRIERHTFTPEDAVKILENQNHINPRRLRKKVAQRYARDMMAGKWKNTWDCIVFDKEGELRNGQHRMEAIAISRVPQTFITIYDAEEFTGDMGLKRSASDIIKDEGGSIANGMVSTFRIATIRSVAYLYAGIIDLTPAEVEEWSRLHIFKRSAEIMHHLDSGKQGIRRANVASAIIGAYALTHDDRIIEFAEILVSGVSQNKSLPVVVAVRDFLMSFGKGLDNRAKGASFAVPATVQLAIRSFLNGATTKRLYRGEKLIYKPSIDDLEEEW